MARTLILTFCGVYIGVSLLLATVKGAFGVSVPAGGVIAAFVAAQICGWRFVARSARRPSFAESNLYTLVFTLCVVVLSIAQVLFNPEVQTLLSDPSMQALTGALLLVTSLSIRIFFPLGAWQAHKTNTQGK